VAEVAAWRQAKWTHSEVPPGWRPAYPIGTESAVVPQSPEPGDRLVAGPLGELLGLERPTDRSAPRQLDSLGPNCYLWMPAWQQWVAVPMLRRDSRGSGGRADVVDGDKQHCAR
jgi:hypothetical protein